MPRPKFAKTWIKQNHSNASPRYIICLDTQSNRQEIGSEGLIAEHTFRLATIKTARIKDNDATANKYWRFRDTESLWSGIYGRTASNYTTWIISHGAAADFKLSKFGLEKDSGRIAFAMPRSVKSRGNGDIDDPHSYKIVAIDGLPFIVGCECIETGGRFVWVDLCNWHQKTLAEIGETVGISQLDKPADNESDDHWFDYSQRNTDIIFAAFNTLIKWCADNAMGMFRYTAASQSMSAFRHGRMKTKIFPHQNSEVKTLERAAYFGGRIECFTIGKIEQTVHLVDVNSMYPFVMSKGFFPTELKHYERNTTYNPVPCGFAADSCCAEVAIHTDRPYYPLRRSSGVCYPIGGFTTTLCGMELAAAIRRQHCTAIRSWASYHTNSIFGLFVSDLQHLRNEHRRSGQRALEELAKLMSNSLYGKWAQRVPKWQSTTKHPPIDDWGVATCTNLSTGEVFEYVSVGDEVLVKGPPKEKDDNFIAISGFICAAARMQMNWIRETAGQGNCFYQGVDSLLVNDDGLYNLQAKNLIHPTELGKCKLKESQPFAELFGCSSYELGERPVMAGLPAMNRKVADGEWMATKLGCFKDLFLKSPPDKVVEYTNLFTARKEYPKGTVAANGRVNPLVLQESADGAVCTSTSVLESNSANDKVNWE